MVGTTQGMHSKGMKPGPRVVCFFSRENIEIHLSTLST